MRLVENMNKELCGIGEIFSHPLERESEDGDHDCVSHCCHGWSDTVDGS